jgi:hypothetical protein
MSGVIHWSGGIRHSRGERLPGWPCCVAGDRAFAIQREGNMTREPDRVTCRACLRMMAKDETPSVRETGERRMGARMTVTLPDDVARHLAVAARRNRDVEPGPGDSVSSLAAAAIESWLRSSPQPTPAEVRRVRAMQRSRRR